MENKALTINNILEPLKTSTDVGEGVEDLIDKKKKLKEIYNKRKLLIEQNVKHQLGDNEINPNSLDSVEYFNSFAKNYKFKNNSTTTTGNCTRNKAIWQTPSGFINSNNKLNKSILYSGNDIINLVLDEKCISEGVKVNYNKAINNSNIHNEHVFAFALLDLNKKEEKTWSVSINRISGWMAIGLGVKELISTINNFKFVSNTPNFKHNCFLLSSNGYIWNSNNPKQDNLFINNFPGFKKGCNLIFNYKPNKKEFRIELEGSIFAITLTEVYSDLQLNPTVVFLANSDEVSFWF